MRVNVYAEEMTDKVELITKEVDGNQFVAVRFYLELPVTIPKIVPGQDLRATVDGTVNVAGPFIHREGDDDSSAVTFWGKQDLRAPLRKALALLDAHYAEQDRQLRLKEPPRQWNEIQGRQ